MLVLEEGQPEYIEQGIQTVLRRQDVQTRVYGKDIMPMAGEYTGQVTLEGLTRLCRECIASRVFHLTLERWRQVLRLLQTTAGRRRSSVRLHGRTSHHGPSGLVHRLPRTPAVLGYSNSCKTETGAISHFSSDIGCHSFATAGALQPRQYHHGLRPLTGQLIRDPSYALPHKAISIMGDGGFWHNGLTSGVTSAVFNKHDGLLIVVDNGYSAATGGQDIPSLVEPNQIIATTLDSEPTRTGRAGRPIDDACRGAGVKWIRTVSTYSIEDMKETLREALTSSEPGLKGDHRRGRVHAQSAAARQTAAQQVDQGR